MFAPLMSQYSVKRTHSVPTMFTVTTRVKARMKLFFKLFTARAEENTLPTTSVDRVPSCQKVWISRLTTGYTTKATRAQATMIFKIRPDMEKFFLDVISGTSLVLHNIGRIQIHVDLLSCLIDGAAVVDLDHPDHFPAGVHPVLDGEAVVVVVHHLAGEL